MIVPYANDAITGTIDWYNEAHVAYIQGEFDRAQIAATMHFAESAEALRLLLLEGTAEFGKVMAMSDKEAKEMEK